VTTATRPTEVILYHHTHWDREWWSTLQHFRLRLVHIVDRLLGILERDPSFSFTLDGQTIVLRDYLEVRPERRAALVHAIQSGRVKVGPWHVLPDEFLVSGEATVRNLLLARRVAADLEIPLSGVGYLPDQFGHIAQMPQILQGFGLSSAVVWRGFGAPPLGHEARGLRANGDVGADYYAFPTARNSTAFPSEMQSEFWWQAPDGSRVLGVYLPLEYYRGHHKHHATDDAFTLDQTVGRARRTVAYLRAYATTNTLLEPIGGDHLDVDERLPEIVAALNRDLEPEGVRYRLGSLDEFVDAVRAAQPNLGVTWRGEGRAYGRRAHLLPGVLSARLNLKRRNVDAQTALERYAEPLQALRWWLGGAYEQNYLWHAWERLIQNHPHDSICGCSSDQVHAEMLPRFDEAEQIARLLAQHALEDIAARVDWRGAPENALPIVAFNPLTWTRTEAVTLALNPHLEIDPQTWILRDTHGLEVPFAVKAGISSLEKYERFSWLQGLLPSSGRAHMDDEYTELQFVAKDLPGLGYRAYTLEPRTTPESHARIRPYTVLGNVARDKGARETTGLRFGGSTLENEHLRVRVIPDDGTLEVTDFATGFQYSGLNALSDGGDGGDTYNFDAPLGDLELHSRSARVSLHWLETSSTRATLRVTRHWLLPSSLTGDRKSRSADLEPFVVHSDVTMYPGVARVDIRTHGVNAVRDHRLRALFPLGAPVQTLSAETQFGVLERPLGIPEGERGSAEPAVIEHPQTGFVSVTDGTRGLTVANRGLPEYSADADGTVALTLLRCVGWLSREDLLSRVGGAGPSLRSPDQAQMIGAWAAEYSLILHGGDWAMARAERHAHDFLAPISAVTTVPQSWGARPEYPMKTVGHSPRIRSEQPNTLRLEGSFLNLEGDVVLDALKRAEDGSGLIVRVHNPRSESVEIRLHAPDGSSTVRLVRLDERPLEETNLEADADGWFNLTVQPHQIRTLHLER
jgi:alpha-mannosidase